MSQKTVGISDEIAVKAPPDKVRLHMLLALCGCIVLSMAPWFSAAAVLPQLRAAWHLSAGVGAWLTIAVQLGFVLGAIVSAIFSLADLVPLRTLMACSAIGAAAANLGLLWAGGAVSAILLRGLVGIFMAGIYPPTLKFIATWYQRGRGIALGSAIGALTLGSALPNLLNAGGGAAWHFVILCTGVAALLSAAGFSLILRDGPFPFPRASFNPAQLRRALLDRPVLLATLGYLGHMWELYAMWSWFLFFTKNATGAFHGAWLAPLLTFVAIAVGAPACVVAGIAADRFGRTLTTIVLMAASGLCAATIGFTFHGPIWVFVAVAVVWGVTIVADSAQFSAVITEVSDPSLVGTALTAQLGLGFALTAVTIWLLPLFAGILGSWQWVFLILVPGPLVGITAMAILRGLPEAQRIAGGSR